MTMLQDLDSSETGTVRRRAKTIVTPKMAMESFRLSFLNDDQDVNFDAILGELSELETQLNSTQSELSQTLGRGGPGHLPQCAPLDGRVEGGSDVIQAELDALAAEITQGLSYRKTNGQL
ncbi:hypothetical protein C0Q70_10015 [Pomacea canaliculata]|uniref:Uncharacterized protein n=1 Tax=Pomacea canaliculata TaxID=400727 RepID=A0A2T7PBE6_POMCA|nr:hypothetical protein C0Q70_10015 [Pomacea canaliculata]